MMPANPDPIQEAVDKCERQGLDLTVGNIAANTALVPGDYNALILSGLYVRVRRWLRGKGFITKDVDNNTKVRLADAKVSDLREQLEVKRRNLVRVTAQFRALEQLVEFLNAKAEELGYDPYVYLFEDDARRIYAMHSLALPSGWGKIV
jgi:hypothetical protein